MRAVTIDPATVHPAFVVVGGVVVGDGVVVVVGGVVVVGRGVLGAVAVVVGGLCLRACPSFWDVSYLASWTAASSDTALDVLVRELAEALAVDAPADAAMTNAPATNAPLATIVAAPRARPMRRRVGSACLRKLRGGVDVWSTACPFQTVGSEAVLG